MLAISECREVAEEVAEGITGPSACKKPVCDFGEGLPDPPLHPPALTTTLAPVSSATILILSLLASLSLPPSPQTSTGSNIAKSISSIPLFWNFAILASVPASTMTLVITLWAWRLYRGMMVLRAEVEEKEEKDVVDEP